jgi:predicted AlkP superfamily phosphohydrolase/phosphomutase
LEEKIMEKKKVLVLGIDGLDPRYLQHCIDRGMMPNTVEFLKRGAAGQHMDMIGGQPTVTPPMWTTLATGAPVSVHGITGYYRHDPTNKEVMHYNFDSTNCKAEQMWNVAAETGYKTLVWHWPGSSWPPSSDNPNLYVVDGTQPEGINIGTASLGNDLLVAGSTKVESPSFRTNAAKNASVPCFIDGLEQAEADDGSGMMERVVMKTIHRVTMDPSENKMEAIKTPMDMVSTTVKPVDTDKWPAAPADAMETVLLLSKGTIRRPALLLKNEVGKYDRIAIYKNKKADQPIVVIENGQWAEDVLDEAIKDDVKYEASRSMRVLDIAEDGTSFRMWISVALDINNDMVWHPKSLLKLVEEKVGYPKAVCVRGGEDPVIIEKIQRESWEHAADWNARAINYMAREQGFDVIFSHFHCVDLQGHMLVQYMKKGRPGVSAEESCRMFDEVYNQTDRYIGKFLGLLDEGWDILIISDHGQTTPEHEPDCYRLNGGAGVVSIDMRKLGYTVMKKDADGNDTNEVDWSKTRAVTSVYNHIFINLKGRDPEGIVDPADKYTLEEQIMTDLYGLKDPETGFRYVAVALRNKDAVLLGEGGPDSGDIVFFISEGYNADHYDNLTTAEGAAHTSVRSTFMAAGPGIKKNYRTARTVHHVDVTPTVAALLGTRMPAQCEGAPVYQIFED